MKAYGTEITWTVFRTQFIENYFLANVHSEKEIEFLELKQENMTVDEYDAKFEELVRFFPHYNDTAVEGLKCIKFESNLCPKIKQFIGY